MTTRVSFPGTRRTCTAWVAPCVIGAWLAAATPLSASAGVGLPADSLKEVEAFARAAAERVASTTPGFNRIEVRLGTPDPRLKLAACRRTEVRAVAGSPAVGRTRVGLHCVDGDARWSISLPVTVEVWGSGLVAVRAVPAGSVLQSSDLKDGIIDTAAERSPHWVREQAPEGRELQRALAPGEALRQSHLRSRQWFAAGDTVRVLGRGAGFTVVGSGQALSAGIEGQTARIRTENGRILSGIASGDRSIEVPL